MPRVMALVNIFSFVLVIYASEIHVNASFFENHDAPGLTSFIYDLNPSRIYLDGARPIYVQRALPRSKLFYDLNSRFIGGDQVIEELCQVAYCFNPEVWAFTKRGKRDSTFLELKSSFKDILSQREDSFVAKHLSLQCPDRQIDCKLLRMER